MESNSRAPALEMNGKETEMVHQKKWAFNWFWKFCKVSDDRIVAYRKSQSAAFMLPGKGVPSACRLNSLNSEVQNRRRGWIWLDQTPNCILNVQLYNVNSRGRVPKPSFTVWVKKVAP